MATVLRGESPTSAASRHNLTAQASGPLRSRRLSSNPRLRSPSSSLRIRPNVPIEDFIIEPSARANGGLNNAVNSAKRALGKKLWIGVLDVPAAAVKEEDRSRVEEALRNQADSLPVWVTEEEFQQHYDGFCHQVLWPSLHYAVPDAPKTKAFYESTSFEQYKAVNQKFADAIVKEYKEGDVVWVNDYHLLLVPQMVRAKLPNVRESLLRGMLGADVVGFQTHSYARHFRQTVSRILTLEALPGGIDLGSSLCEVAIFPIGIDVLALAERRRDPTVQEWVDVLKERYAGMKMIVGRDKLDEVQGVRQKLLAFEAFLEKYSEFQGKVVLIQVALATTEENEGQVAVFDVVSRINSRSPQAIKIPIRPKFDHRLKSIVDDLTLRVESGTPVSTPAPETVPNPFSSFTAMATVLRGESPTSAASRHNLTAQASGPLRSRRLSSNPRLRSPSSSLRIRPNVPIEDFIIEPSARANGGLNNAVNSAKHALRKKLWIGVLDVPAAVVKEEDRSRVEEALRNQADSLPVWVTEEEFQQHYDGFCHQVLWPSLHYAVPDAPKTKAFYESTSFEQYKAVNQKFADAIVPEIFINTRKGM
ncbi:hypothetical protein RSAG8_00988, partial [Rhizoctonia solani AG-8 WAC10335]